MEEAFDVRHPTAMIILAHHSDDVAADRVVAAVDEELDRIATDGVPEAELDRIRARTASAMLQRADHVLARTLAMASYEQQRGRAELVGEMPALLAEVTAEQVAAAAATLRPDSRARLDVVPDGAR
jgi:predicted Zn-dependent peptidase